MRIAVYGATGMLGSRIAAEARSRDHEVTAISRSGGEGQIKGNAADKGFAARIAAGHEVVVSAIGPSRTHDDGTAFQETVANLVATLGEDRLLVVGGAGSLEVDGVALFDTPGFPQENQTEARKSAAVLADLRELPDGIDWTYLSPAPVVAPGRRTGCYEVAEDSPAGESISAEDYAVAVVDEIERPAHRRARFTVAN